MLPEEIVLRSTKSLTSLASPSLWWTCLLFWTLPVYLKEKKYQCTGFLWKGFYSSGTMGVASVRSCQKFSPCLIKPVPASSKKMDRLLAKAEPISDGGSSSVTTYLRREKKKPSITAFSARERRWCERNSSAHTQVREGGGGGAPGTRAEIPLQLMEKTLVRQAVPQQSMKVHSEADIHLQPMEDPTLEPEEDCDPVGSPRWSRLWAGPVNPRRERSPCWSRFAGRTCDPAGRTHAGAVPEELHPVGRTHAGAVCGGLSLVSGTLLWSGGGLWRGRSGRDNTWWTNHSPHSPSPCTTQGEEVEKIRSEAEPRKKGRVGGRCFKIWFYFSLSYCDLIGDKLN